MTGSSDPHLLPCILSGEHDYGSSSPFTMYPKRRIRLGVFTFNHVSSVGNKTGSLLHCYHVGLSREQDWESSSLLTMYRKWGTILGVFFVGNKTGKLLHLLSCILSVSSDLHRLPCSLYGEHDFGSSSPFTM